MLFPFGLYYYMLSRRNMVVFALVGVWVFIALAVKQWDAEPIVRWTSLVAATFLLTLAFEKYRSLGRLS